MTRVAFWFDAPLEYSGGINYFKNLLYALSLVNAREVSPYIFLPHHVPADIEARFAQYATVVKTRLIQPRTLPWWMHQLLYRVTGSMWLVNMVLRYHKIDILSHVWFVYKGRAPFPILGWIPDFQYLHLPELFPTLDQAAETRQNQKIIAQSDVMILSSHDALEDFRRIAEQGHQHKGAVLQFVSQPSASASSPQGGIDAVRERHRIGPRFFHLPNQFWAHKNHMVVFRALKLLKDRGVDVQVVCTGNTHDFRVKNTDYIDGIHAYIEQNGLQEQVRILGQIDYGDVLQMMDHAVAVLNPSRFEGWSSSVEEAKSMGQMVVLSNIGVHLEQAPVHSRYFDPEDADMLADVLAELWAAGGESDRASARQQAERDLRERTLAFGEGYLRLIRKVRQEASRGQQLRTTRSGA